MVLLEQMTSELSIPIVVVAYNRPRSLSRILQSLDNALYPYPVELIISIDKSDVPEVLDLATKFIWRHGKKRIIAHSVNLGLRKHVLACGSLSSDHDAIILLEDDLFVSPGFYTYTVQAIGFYSDDPKISGISLYAHAYNETAHKTFIPLSDNSDVFFMQLPSSWGQCWTKSQWSDFLTWYDVNKESDITIQEGIPDNVAYWPETSWKKYFVKFLIDTDRYFVYPRFSLTTNCGDPGTHFNNKLNFQQVPLLTVLRDFKFSPLSDSMAVYDANCELLPAKLNLLVPCLGKFSYTVDLYGCKSKYQIRTKYVLTTRKCTEFIQAFSREIKPHEANVISGIEGNEIFLTRVSNCIWSKSQTVLSENELGYFFKLRAYQIPQTRIIYKDREHTTLGLFVMLLRKIMNRLSSLFRRKSVS